MASQDSGRSDIAILNNAGQLRPGFTSNACRKRVGIPLILTTITAIRHPDDFSFDARMCSLCRFIVRLEDELSVSSGLRGLKLEDGDG